MSCQMSGNSIHVSSNGTISVNTSSESTTSDNTTYINCRTTLNRKMVLIQEIGTNTEKHTYWERVQVRVSNSSQSLNKQLVELSSRQVSKQESEHPSEAKQAGVKLMYNTRCYHAPRGYRLRHSYLHMVKHAYEHHITAHSTAMITG